MGSYGQDDNRGHKHGAPWQPYPPEDHAYHGEAHTAAPEPRIPLRLRLLLVLPVAALCAVMAVIGGLFIYYTLTFPDPLSMRLKASGPQIRILANDGSLLADRGVSRAYIPLDLLPPHVTNAVVAIEDRRFFEHPGLDLKGLARAMLVNFRAGRFQQGGSTLTQQLAKNLFLSSERTLSRKAEELVLALWLELRLSKQELLELYLNRVYFGAGAHGIEAAAQRYFAKSARDLSIAEGAMLAGLLKAPSKYSPSASRETAAQRARVVISQMRDAGFITEGEEIAAKAEDMQFSATMREPQQADVAYAVDYVLDRAALYEGSDHKEIIIETTLDANLQRSAGEILARELQQQGAQLSASQAAMVVVAPDGGIRALVGGRSYAQSQYNRAVQARRQPGSAFKPVVYLAAIENGLSPDSIVQDEPVKLGTWEPKNENGRYSGATTVREALARSLNTVAVRLVLDLGAAKVAGTAERLGMKSVLRTDTSLALGTSEVSLTELAGAYGAFANGGYVHEPYAIRRVRTGTGRVLFKRLAATSDPTIAPKHVGQMNDMLQAAVVSGTARRAALDRHPTAGKTGTSQDFRDAWFIGYTAHLTAGVWVGNDNGEPMQGVLGGSLPAEIWRKVMAAAHAGLSPEALPDGSGRVGPPKDLQIISQSQKPDAQAPASFPDQRIEETFLARVLKEGDKGAAPAIATATAQGETIVDPTSGSIVVKPPVRQ